MIESRTGWAAAGRALRVAREAAGVRQVAAFPGRSPAWLSQVEAGRIRPSHSDVREMAARLSIPTDVVDYLLYQWWGDPLPPLEAVPGEGAVRMCSRHGGYIHQCPWCASERRGNA